MRIIFLGKRHPQQRDLIERPYGRFHYLPVTMAALGHDVRVMLCSHRRLPALEHDADGVHWSSRDVRTLGPARLLRELAQQALAFRPDWIVGMSDAQYGWLAHRLSKRCTAKLAIDAYDNYEAYMPWNAPLHWLWRRALRAADLVTAAGPQLADLLQSHRALGRPVEVLPMAADPEFRPREKLACRTALGLPKGAPLLGYVGSWTSSRGTQLIVDAFQRIRAAQPATRLVLSGRPPAAVLQLPAVIGLGYLPDSQMPLLVSALDVACVVTADTSFGKFSYPAKLCEAMACKVPVIASATDAVRWMLGNRAEHLARVGDPGDFANRALELLEVPRVDYGDRPDWYSIGARLNALLT